MLECTIGVLVAVQHSIADDQVARVESTTIQHARKVDSVLDILRGILMGMASEKLHVAIFHIETKRR